jgi:hypothetical protein
MFPATTKLDNIYKALNEIAAEKFPGADLQNPGKSKVKGLKSPILRADEKVADVTSKGEAVDLDGWTMVRANAFRSRPVVRNARGEVVEEDDLDVEAYSGRWMRFMVRPSAYDQDGGRGVKFYLEGVQLLGNDDPIGGFKRTDGAAFGAVDDEDDEI